MPTLETEIGEGMPAAGIPDQKSLFSGSASPGNRFCLGQKTGLVLLLGMAAGVFFFRLGVPAFWNDEEARNAECAREMLAGGDWVVPIFNYEIRSSQPILLDWLMMASYSLLGITEFAARFPSALLATGTLLLVYRLGRILFDRTTAFWSAMMLLTCLGFSVLGRSATPDATLVFLLTSALLCFVESIQRRQPNFWSSNNMPTENGNAAVVPHGMWIALGYVMMNLAVLTIGPHGLLLPVFSLFIFLYGIRRMRALPQEEGIADGSNPRQGKLPLGRSIRGLCSVSDGWQAMISLRPVTAILIHLAMIVPWMLLVTVRTNGVWVPEFINIHNIGRFLHPMEGRASMPFYYVMALPVMFFPWSLLLVPMISNLIPSLRRMKSGQPAILLLSSWILVFVGFFSLSATKQSNDIAPVLPAMALLAGRLLTGWLRSPSFQTVRQLRGVSLSMGLTGAALAVVLIIGASRLAAGEEILAIVGLPLVIGAVAVWGLASTRRLASAGACLMTAGCLFALTLHGFAAPRISSYQDNRLLGLRVRNGQMFSRANCLISYGPEASSLVYYTRGKVHHAANSQQLARHWAEHPQAYVVTRSDLLPKLRRALPESFTVIARYPRLFQDQDMVLLGPEQRRAFAAEDQQQITR